MSLLRKLHQVTTISSTRPLLRAFLSSEVGATCKVPRTEEKKAKKVDSAEPPMKKMPFICPPRPRKAGVGPAKKCEKTYRKVDCASLKSEKSGKCVAPAAGPGCKEKPKTDKKEKDNACGKPFKCPDDVKQSKK